MATKIQQTRKARGHQTAAAIVRVSSIRPLGIGHRASNHKAIEELEKRGHREAAIEKRGHREARSLSNGHRAGIEHQTIGHRASDIRPQSHREAFIEKNLSKAIKKRGH